MSQVTYCVENQLYTCNILGLKAIVMLFHNLNSTAEKSDFFIKTFMEVPLYMDINSSKYWTAIYLI